MGAKVGECVGVWVAECKSGAGAAGVGLWWCGGDGGGAGIHTDTQTDLLVLLCRGVCHQIKSIGNSPLFFRVKYLAVSRRQRGPEL